MFLSCGPVDFTSNGRIDVRWTKNIIIIYYIFATISTNCIIFNNIIMFHTQDEVEQMMFWGQCGWLFENVIWLLCGPHMTNNGWTTSCVNSPKFSKIKLVKVLNKLNWPHMVDRMSLTPTLRSTSCPFPSSNYVSMKYSQKLTYAIMICIVVESFVLISSSNSLSLFEKFELRF